VRVRRVEHVNLIAVAVVYREGYRAALAWCATRLVMLPLLLLLLVLQMLITSKEIAIFCAGWDDALQANRIDIAVVGSMHRGQGDALMGHSVPATSTRLNHGAPTVGVPAMTWTLVQDTARMGNDATRQGITDSLERARYRDVIEHKIAVLVGNRQNDVWLRFWLIWVIAISHARSRRP
jgi:hypothetical protein